jgi:hypothetical protein
MTGTSLAPLRSSTCTVLVHSHNNCCNRDKVTGRGDCLTNEMSHSAALLLNRLCGRALAQLLQRTVRLLSSFESMTFLIMFQAILAQCNNDPFHTRFINSRHSICGVVTNLLKQWET